MANFIKSERFQKMGDKIMVRLFPDMVRNGVTVLFLESDKRKTGKGRVTFGECVKVGEMYRGLVPYDFLIVVYAANCEEYKFDEERYEILIEHELRHVGYKQEKRFIVPHDTQEFESIIDKYGLHWARGGVAM